MFYGDAVSQREAKARSLLLAFAHKGFEEVVANIFRYTFAIIDDIHGHMLLLDFQGHQNSGLRSSSPNRLASIEEKVEHGAFDLLPVDDRCSLRWITKPCQE